jgi:hypothetical protein
VISRHCINSQEKLQVSFTTEIFWTHFFSLGSSFTKLSIWVKGAQSSSRSWGATRLLAWNAAACSKSLLGNTALSSDGRWGPKTSPAWNSDASNERKLSCLVGWVQGGEAIWSEVLFCCWECKADGSSYNIKDYLFIGCMKALKRDHGNYHCLLHYFWGTRIAEGIWLKGKCKPIHVIFPKYSHSQESSTFAGKKKRKCFLPFKPGRPDSPVSPGVPMRPCEPFKAIWESSFLPRSQRCSSSPSPPTPWAFVIAWRMLFTPCVKGDSGWGGR